MVLMTFSLLSSQRPSDIVHSGSLPFLLRLDGLYLYLSIQPLPDTVHTRLYLMVSMTFSLLSSQRPSNTVHSGSLPFLRRLDALYLYLSVQPQPDTVHTRLFLTVALTLSLHSLQRQPNAVHSASFLADPVFASLEGLPFLCRLDGLCSPHHPAAA
jgi:hypothetical protein